MNRKVKYLFRPIIGEYDFVNKFHQGLACVKKDGKYAFIDKTGKVVIAFNNYDYVSSFKR